MKIGKIAIDREYTKPSEEAQVKEDIKKFQDLEYTAEGLLEWFRDDAERYDIYGEIVKCKITAFPAGWAWDNVTSFSVEMILDGSADMWRLWFYFDLENGMHTGLDQFGGLRYTATRYARV